LSTPEPLLRIRDALREDAALPALGQAVSAVSRMAADQSDTVDRLAQAILSDVSLTQRLLRCANSALYRTADASPVTTVSRALVLLGFDQVRTLALSMMLVDRFVDGPRARPVMRDFGQALAASAIARGALQRCWPACAEEAAIGAMFRSVGRLVASVHVPDAVSEVRAALLDGEPESAAARRVIGRSFDELTLEVVSGWGLPQRIQHALQPCPLRPVTPRTSNDWVHVAAAFGDASAALERRNGQEGRDRTVGTLARRFGDPMGLEADAIAAILARAHEDTLLLAQALGLSSLLSDAPAGAAGRGAAHGRIRADAGDARGSGEGRDASEAPGPSAADRGNGRSGGPVRSAGEDRRLLSTLARISEALADSHGTGRVAQIAADALHDVLGARCVVWFARDDAAAAFRPRCAAGCELGSLRGRVSMPVQFAPDLFHAALARGADLHIADVAAEPVRNRLPAWLPSAFPDARGFVLLPVMVDGRPLGFFYADRAVAGAPAPDAGQVEAIRTLRNQLVLALRTEPAMR
jgi:HD-like signal output (HDOD) protein